MLDIMWQQAAGGFKQVLNQTRLSRNVTGIFKFVLAHNCRFELVDELITNLSYSFQDDQQWVMHISSHKHVSTGCRCTREPNPMLTSELVHQCLTKNPMLT